MQDEHGPHAFADDEIALPVAHVGEIIDRLWAVVPGMATLPKGLNQPCRYRIGRGCRASRQTSGLRPKFQAFPGGSLGCNIADPLSRIVTITSQRYTIIIQNCIAKRDQCLKYKDTAADRSPAGVRTRVYLMRCDNNQLCSQRDVDKV